MTDYIIKSTVCSGLLLLCYHLFLEKEKMHRFNRFYLLFSICFALLIPLVSIELESKIRVPVVIENHLPKPFHQSDFTSKPSEVSSKSNFSLSPQITIYVLISILLLIRFLKNLRSVVIIKHSRKVLDYHGAKLVLIPENTVTYTFLNHIFVSENAFNEQKIEDEVLTHELAHVHQKHSLDILFIELIQILFWFNPFVLLYKKAIQLNHEFLADEAVLQKYFNAKNYQLMLLDKILDTRKVSLTSRFNYSITKKRLTMMTRNTSKKAILTKKILLIPTISLLVFIFASRVQSQQQAIDKPVNTKTKIDTSDGVSQKHFDEYQNMLKKAISTRVIKGNKVTHIDFSTLDIQRLDVIYRSMSDEQRSVATKVNFIPMGPAPEKTPPTQQQLDAWLNSKKYGVWLDDNRIENDKLKQYKPSDFDYYFVSKLEKNAINYGKHYFQVGVMSKKAFKEWHDKKLPLSTIPD